MRQKRKIQTKSLTLDIPDIERLILRIVILIIFLKDCYDFLLYSLH